MSGPVFNQQNSGSGNQNVQGMEITLGDLNNRDQPDPVPTVDRFLAAIESPEILPDDISDDIMPDLNRFACMPAAEQEEVMATPRWMQILEAIRPHSHAITKGIAVFSGAALKAFAVQNPVCAGIMAVCDEIKDSQSSNE